MLIGRAFPQSHEPRILCVVAIPDRGEDMTLTRALWILAQPHPTFKSLSYIKSRLNRRVYGCVCLCVCMCVCVRVRMLCPRKHVSPGGQYVISARQQPDQLSTSLSLGLLLQPPLSHAGSQRCLFLHFPAIILPIFLKLVKLTFLRCPPLLPRISQPSPPPWEAQERARARQQEDSEAARNA